MDERIWDKDERYDPDIEPDIKPDTGADETADPSAEEAMDILDGMFGALSYEDMVLGAIQQLHGRIDQLEMAMVKIVETIAENAEAPFTLKAELLDLLVRPDDEEG